MRTLFSVSVLGLALTVPVVALAQPADPAAPVDPAGAGSGSATAPAPVPNPADDSRIKEIVDRELARVLNERAAKEAADRAAAEQRRQGSRRRTRRATSPVPTGSWIPASRSR